jgi:hypothetical protein
MPAFAPPKIMKIQTVSGCSPKARIRQATTIAGRK